MYNIQLSGPRGCRKLGEEMVNLSLAAFTYPSTTVECVELTVNLQAFLTEPQGESLTVSRRILSFTSENRRSSMSLNSVVLYGKWTTSAKQRILMFLHILFKIVFHTTNRHPLRKTNPLQEGAPDTLGTSDLHQKLSCFLSTSSSLMLYHNHVSAIRTKTRIILSSWI
jgi:hypothetical protein